MGAGSNFFHECPFFKDFFQGANSGAIAFDQAEAKRKKFILLKI